jgi:predicted DNA-binding transcriptional regulator AlpA
MTTPSHKLPAQDTLLRVPAVTQRLGGVSRSYWWAGIKDGRFPPGIKLSPRVTVWRSSDIDALIATLGK